MVPLIVEPVVRNDAAGSGLYGASRGNRKHRGVDYLCRPGGLVFSPVAGVVSKLGYPYGDDLTWRYVQITDDHGNRHRVFYCLPLVNSGEMVLAGEVIGEAQDISTRYPGQGMQPHIHYELINEDGDYVNPEHF